MRQRKAGIRNRIVGLRQVKAGELLADPRNWRRHPKAQRDALSGVLAEIGYADALLARETPGGLMLVDGHLRAGLDADQEVPVLVLDLDEAEAGKLIATLDPLAAMAQPDQDALLRLLGNVEFENQAIREMLEALANGETQPLREPNDPYAEWQGMPEFIQDDLNAWKSLIIHFKDEEDFQAFIAAIGYTPRERKRSFWFPQAVEEGYITKRYVENAT